MGDSAAGGKGDNRGVGSRLKNKNLQLTYIKHSVHFLRQQENGQEEFFPCMLYEALYSCLNITQSRISYESAT